MHLVMARRRGRRTTKRRSRRGPQKFNILNAAEGVIIGSAVTKGFFGVELVPWLTEGWLLPQTTSSNNSWELSLAELVKGIVPGGKGFGQSGNVSHGWTNDAAGVMKAIKHNLGVNGGQMIGTMIIAPIAFRSFKKLAGKPLRMVNRTLKMSGVPVKV